MAPDNSHRASVWRLALPNEAPEDRRLLALLENAERRRADRFSNAAARRRFLLCRAALRLLLAERLQTDPAALRLIAGDHGKPRLAVQPAGLSFNVSHTGDLALIALADGCPLGVDVEATRSTRSLTAIARRCFAPAEFSHWQALPETESALAFFTLWTRKEAFAKAVGNGIAIGLERIEFGPDGGLIAVPPECGTAKGWQVQDLKVGEGYSAAIAMESPAISVELRDFETTFWA